MTKLTSKNRLLAHAVLSSTLFVTPLAFSQSYGPGVVLGPKNTNAEPDNIVRVLPQGVISTVAGSSVSLDSIGGTIITDPNFSGVASGIQASNGDAINISFANGIVDIGAGTIVISNAGGSGVDITNTAANTFISNSGYMFSNNTATLNNNAANTTLINNAGGTIIQPVFNASTILSTATDFTLINSGSITLSTPANALPTLNIQNSFAQIVNLSGGIIQNLNGTLNSHGISIGNVAASGDIINHAGGLIYTGTGAGNAIFVTSDTTSNIINAGTVHAAGALGIAVNLAGNINSLINSGQIISASNATIFANNNVQIPEMIINNGNITNLTAGSTAINLSSAGVQATFIQNAGEVRGNVLLAQNDSANGQDVFFMNGGAILGSVTANANNTLALQGGTISGNVNGNAAANFFNLSGTHVLGILNGNDGDDEFNVTGGSYGSIDGGNGLDILNFDRTITSNGFITNVESINVIAGTLTLNSPIINMGAGAGGTGLIIDPGTTLILNASISGQNNITNSGIFNTNSAQVISLTGAGTFTNNNGSILHLGTGAGLEILAVAPNAFTSQSGSTFEVDLGSATQYGHLIVDSPGAGSVTFNPGSFIAPKVKGFLPQGSVYEIVRQLQIAGSTIVDNNSALVQSSAVVTFNKTVGLLNTSLLLLANRTPYAAFAIDPTQGLASALDFAARGDGPTDAYLAYLMGQIDGLATASEVSDALIALTPPSNNGLVQASFTGMNTAFERINERMYDMHLWMQQQAELNSGVNSGDKFGVLGFWAQALGAHLNQHERDGLDGYDANSGGLALGVDWRYNDCTALGFAISYNKAKVNDHFANPKDENIRSWQGTTYAWIDYANGMYINAIMGLAFNDYDVDRTIRFNQINTVSNGNFDGWQFGLQTDAGWFLINSNDYFVTPFVRLKYTMLDLDNYTETGAGPLSLRVENERIDQLLGGVGVKFGKPFTSKHLVFIPEVTTLVSYDFINDGEQSTANFVGNSLEFATNGVKPGRTAFDLGIGVSTHIDEQSIFTIKYDLELRDKFNANSAYLEYYYLWG